MRNFTGIVASVRKQNIHMLNSITYAGKYPHFSEVREKTGKKFPAFIRFRIRADTQECTTEQRTVLFT